MMRTTRIKASALSDARRLPRLGKVRLGVKKVSAKSGKEYPAETAHFVVTERVAEIYGNEPTELDVILPVEDEGVVFPQALEYYGSGTGLKCSGDGEVAWMATEQGIQQRECPCAHLRTMENESGECTPRAHLSVILPKVSLSGVWQIDTGSKNSIIDLNSSIDYVRALVGRVSWVPLTLSRAETQTVYKGKRATHYTMRLEYRGTIEEAEALRRRGIPGLSGGGGYTLPPPEQENPAEDAGMVVDEETGEVLAAPMETNEESASAADMDASDRMADEIAALGSVEELHAWWRANKGGVERSAMKPALIDILAQAKRMLL